MSEPKLFSPADAARELDVAVADVRAAIEDGVVTPQQPGGRFVLTESDLDVLRAEFENLDDEEAGPSEGEDDEDK